MYAENTRVPVSRTKAAIEDMLTKEGAIRTGITTEPERVTVMFQMKDRLIRFQMPIPARTEMRFTHVDKYRKRAQNAADLLYDQHMRSLWRSLLLSIKAKFVSIENGVETFDTAFLAHIVVSSPDGHKTVGQLALPQVAQTYSAPNSPLALPPGDAQ